MLFTYSFHIYYFILVFACFCALVNLLFYKWRLKKPGRLMWLPQRLSVELWLNWNSRLVLVRFFSRVAWCNAYNTQAFFLHSRFHLDQLLVDQHCQLTEGCESHLGPSILLLIPMMSSPVRSGQSGCFLNFKQI